MSKDIGIVVYDRGEKLYYTGLGWDRQLRNAKIYHSKLYANRIIENNPSLDCILCPVSISIIE